MSKEISRDDAVERLMHHLRGHILLAVMKEYREPFQVSLYFKSMTATLMQQIGEILDAYKQPGNPPQTSKK